MMKRPEKVFVQLLEDEVSEAPRILKLLRDGVLEERNMFERLGGVFIDDGKEVPIPHEDAKVTGEEEEPAAGSPQSPPLVPRWIRPCMYQLIMYITTLLD